MEAGIGIFIICCMSILSPFYGVDKEGQLHGCAPSPNCVSSGSWEYNYIHHIEPITYNYDSSTAFKRMHTYFENSENIHIDEVISDQYIRVTYFTKVFRFPDRVELFFPKDQNHIEVRSHSWIGLWDVFANRLRIARFRNIIDSENPPTSETLF
ncbi:DUF1499 domain-containing protein [Leptospira sp. GIMC2001]|uniref:DUF1499 domain-containing protein n=1 Tax=Leptospira sp. GIMC2001 TaxID=1513297 RepID=UPI00234BCE14|nr:DUF1499 domain-containing protein [Leptospira sp. GIMC2001]WCL47796.1 DUF1499 domain-containing protein [Leptospira sp. GIMC2001]